MLTRTGKRRSMPVSKMQPTVGCVLVSSAQHEGTASIYAWEAESANIDVLGLHQAR